jgi:hypothetical protein
MVFSSDRRRYPRYSICLPVSVFFLEKRIMTHTLDVGLGGMKIYADQVLPFRQEFLFRMVLGPKFIWIKGRIIFTQTQPDAVNFSCIQFAEASKENLLILQEYFSQRENLLERQYIELEARLREREAALAKAAELLNAEKEIRKRGEQAFKELEEWLRYLSAEFPDGQKKKIHLTGQELLGDVEAMVKGMAYAVKRILLCLKEEEVPDSISFEQIVGNLRGNYKEIRRILKNLFPFVTDELEVVARISRYYREVLEIYNDHPNAKEMDHGEEAGLDVVSCVQRRRPS